MATTFVTASILTARISSTPWAMMASIMEATRGPKKGQVRVSGTTAGTWSGPDPRRTKKCMLTRPNKTNLRLEASDNSISRRHVKKTQNLGHRVVGGGTDGADSTRAAVAGAVESERLS